MPGALTWVALLRDALELSTSKSIHWEFTFKNAGFLRQLAHPPDEDRGTAQGFTLFSSSLLSDIRVVSSAYLRLLIFLPAILIPVCVSSSPAFCMTYSAYKLNKQSDNIQR